MFRRFVAICSCIIGASLPSLGYAKEIRLPSSSKWVMDYASDSCQLVRAFGSGEDETLLQFVRYKSEARFDLNVIGKTIGLQSPHPTVRIQFGNTGSLVRTNAVSGKAGSKPALFLAGRLDNLDLSELDPDDFQKMSAAELGRLDTVDPAVEAAVNALTVVAGSRRLVFQLGSMGPPMAAMRKCTTDLITGWGLNAAEQAALVSPPRPKSNPGAWLSSSDYPGESLARGEQALIRFRLMIDAAGNTSACSIQSAIAKGDFAKVTCDLIKRRARFEPARNAKNENVASYFVGKVFWMMP